MFKGIGEMAFKLADDGSFTLENGDYAMSNVTMGGNLPNGTMNFRIDMDSLPAVDDGFTVLDDLLPNDVKVTVSGGKKLDAGKAATIKYAKNKASGQFSLTGLDDPKKPNLSGLKLTYTPKTGLFKGSFKMYAISSGAKPKLKKYMVNVTGFVVNGAGVGKATLKKPRGEWLVTLE